MPLGSLVIHFDIIKKGHHQGDHEKTSTRQNKKEQRFKTQHVISEYGSGTKKFTDKPDCHHTDQETKAHTETIPERRRDRFLTGKHLKPHGDNGEGNDDFYKDGNTDGRFLNAILHGKGMMQSHADKLSPAERWEVIHYIRSLQATEKGVDYNPVAAVNVAPSMEETMEAVTEEHTEEQHEEAHDGDGHGK